MKNGNFSPESIDLFKELVRADGGESNLTSDGANPFEFSLKTSSDRVPQMFAEVGQIRGEYIDNYDYTRCVRPNGTFYGTSGQCRLGTETEAKPKPESEIKKETYTGKKFRSIPDQKLADLPDSRLTKIRSKIEETLEKNSQKITPEQKTFLERELKRLEDETDTRIGNWVKTLKADKSEEVRRKGGALVGDSPRNLAISGWKDWPQRMRDARSEKERRFLRKTAEEMKEKFQKKYG
jgi:hypothetical protein